MDNNMNINIEALIESRVEAAISAVQDLPQLLEEAVENNSVVVLSKWWDILTHMYDNLITPTGTLRFLHEIEFPMVSNQDRPRYDDFIKVAHRWLVSMHCAGVGEQALANLAQYKPRLTTEVLEVLAPHEREIDERRYNRRTAVDQEYPGHIRSEAEFWLRKGALMTTTEEKMEYVQELVEAMANMTDIADRPNHHQVEAVKAISGSVLEELAWEVYVHARDAQKGRTRVLPWNTNFTWRSYPTFDDRWADIVDCLEECKSAVANLMQATYIQRYTCDPHREHTRKVGQKRNNDTKAEKAAANAQAAQQLQAIQGATVAPGPALPAMANLVQAMSSNVAPAFAAPQVAPVTSPFETSNYGNAPAAPPNSPNTGLMAPAPDVSMFESDEVLYKEFGF
ncbi:hypothetical protein NCU07601 [Neurospora crassa OR74A]|uniref:Uncharacterized protein n=1 Tax=Neurospora crassa (strain ATCC 24698 / 74-OR23-1A / CBS 708.71 / DSM 1257 / FGSC 987) TaxID=367110 RepID=Q7SBF5_NEUCR|nr:hypothetical protein NCU07601 [Neurospora crassa OR74A]EAA33745.3 hypothetical protein NCU07601 [Neurospora crassa OR74A]|eukprot:XP_962981.3 hypothetical protein NCU07601 [Neurospora crassa OR74A]